MKKILLLITVLLSVSVYSQTFQTGTITLTFNDATRTGGFGSGGGPGRQIQTEIYYPATVAGSNVAVATGSFPVVVFGHGFVMDWGSYDNVFSLLSKRGYIVALPRTEGGFSPSHSEFGLDLAVVGNKLMQLNITNTLAPIFVGKVIQKLALAGHSMGGGSSFLAAKNNPSITCLFNFAAAQTNPTSSNAAKQVFVPTLIIGGQSDCVAPAATNQDKMWDSTAASKKYEIIIKNLTHCDFGNGTNFNCTFGQNSSNCPNTVNNLTALNLYMNFVNPFLDFNLKGICNEGTRFMDSLNLSQVIFSKKQLGVLACAPVFLNERENLESVKIFPNPAKDIFIIEGIDEKDIKVDVFTILGQALDAKILKSDDKIRVDISEFPSGIYVIKLSNKDTSILKRIVKE
ncbi:MAG: T9SS type A sorting domain-containing protein [Bacteroidota bacterium]|nr:T9SS type A sorting domain-containing protein [Bacteroidota bacterium]MDP3145151.1 T9SS type A sorting domain-containing protein [Bacteroidota bacterium]